MTKRQPADSPVTFDTVRKIALALANAEESTSYGTPAFKVGGALFTRLHQDGCSLVVRIGMQEREELMAEDPGTYYITDHYRNYPWVLVRLSRVHPDALRDLLGGARRSAAAEKRRKSGSRKASQTARDA
ncbi:MAG: MmcQ/YjbR family DNA-binding protein [Bryobacteraceae bacterium]